MGSRRRPCIEARMGLCAFIEEARRDGDRTDGNSAPHRRPVPAFASIEIGLHRRLRARRRPPPTQESLSVGAGRPAGRRPPQRFIERGNTLRYGGPPGLRSGS